MKSELQKQKERLYKKEKNHEMDFLTTLEIFRAMSNSYRIKILIAVYQNPSISVDQINQIVGGDFKNISAHTKKLYQANLLYKDYKQNNFVLHRLSPNGKKMIKFLKEHSTIL